MKAAISMVATGGVRYWRFLSPLIASLKQFFPFNDVVVFTDSTEKFDAIKLYWPHMGWPYCSFFRLHAILTQKELFSKYDQVFVMDPDMLVRSQITEEDVFSEGIAAVLHPSFVNDFERRPESTAFVAGNPPYYQACFYGGRTDIVLEMCEIIKRNIEIDEEHRIHAIIHDESHFNRYLVDHPPAKVLSPAYAYPTLTKHLVHPETWMKGSIEDFIPKIEHLEKPNQATWKAVSPPGKTIELKTPQLNEVPPSPPTLLQDKKSMPGAIPVFRDGKVIYVDKKGIPL